MKLRTFTITLLTMILTVFLISCASKPIAISQDLTAAELVQRAQEASDKNRFAVSLQYYETILERFSHDMEYVCAAEYEIAFIQFKQKKYDVSRTGFNNLLERYNSPDEELLPPQYKILAKKILSSIPETENRGRRSGQENT